MSPRPMRQCLQNTPDEKWEEYQWQDVEYMFTTAAACSLRIPLACCRQHIAGSTACPPQEG